MNAAAGNPLSDLCRRAESTSAHSARQGFTLVELLVTMAIMAVLASMILGVAAVAGESAREARTKALVARLHTLLMDQWDQYRERRVELSGSYSGKALADARREGTREQLKLDFPDRWSDILLAGLGSDSAAPLAGASAGAPGWLAQRTSLSKLYLRRYEAIRGNTNATSGAANTAEDLRKNQGAECLYLIIMFATGDGEARGLFKESDIGDTDGDGAPEFLDGWGNPIEFLRWASGFDSDIQLSRSRLEELRANPPTGLTGDEAVQQAVAQDHDPFDLFRGDTFVVGNTPRGFRLVPLIFSRGGDEEFGLTNNPAFVNAASDPYVDIGTSHFLGARLDDTATDNVHNHLIKTN